MCAVCPCRAHVRASVIGQLPACRRGHVVWNSYMNAKASPQPSRPPCAAWTKARTLSRARKMTVPTVIARQVKPIRTNVEQTPALCPPLPLLSLRVWGFWGVLGERGVLLHSSAHKSTLLNPPLNCPLSMLGPFLDTSRTQSSATPRPRTPLYCGMRSLATKLTWTLIRAGTALFCLFV